MDIFLGRQPILTTEGQVYAYELLYRNSEENRFSATCPERATATVLVNAFLSIGIDEVSGDSLSFINFNETMLEQDFMTNLNPRQVVIELLEDVEITPGLIRRLRELREMGFRIALDDFILTADFQYPELFQFVNIIKVDFLNTTPGERANIEALIQKYPNLTLLAEKVETKEDFDFARKQGYRLFQGYYFAKPEMIKSRDIPANFSLYLHILNEIKRDAPDIDEITELVMHDVSLSYKLLKYINSLAFDVPYEIRSIRQAIMLIGINETQKWLQVLLLYDMGKELRCGRTKALVEASLVRAKFCELLAKQVNKCRTDEYFLVGMFSMIDLIMQKSWEDLLADLPLNEIVKETVQGIETSLTPFLEIAKALEKFDLETVQELAEDLDVPMSRISKLSIDVQEWIYRFDRLII